jgi:hypothetical protein
MIEFDRNKLERDRQRLERDRNNRDWARVDRDRDRVARDKQNLRNDRRELERDTRRECKNLNPRPKYFAMSPGIVVAYADCSVAGATSTSKPKASDLPLIISLPFGKISQVVLYTRHSKRSRLSNLFVLVLLGAKNYIPVTVEPS